MFHSSYLEIKRSALQNNIHFLKQQLGPNVILSSVIKGNAYGHGIEAFAPLAQNCGISHFSVFSADEALRLMEALPRPATIMIMGYVDLSEIEWAITNDLEFYVFDWLRLEATISTAKKLKKPALIHLELETGMNRTGFDIASLESVRQLLLSNRPYIQLKGLCTHFAGAESSDNHQRVSMQQERFKTQIQVFKEAGVEATILHAACSAAMMAYPSSQLDMVRVGIMQYGFWPSPEIKSNHMSNNEGNVDPLQRLITWKSKIMSLKNVAAGDYIGYGNTYKAEQDILLAIVPVGYAWGYSRSLSNLGQVLIHEQSCNVVGIVNMNIMMVNVTTVPAVKEGDEVVLLGTQGKENITVASFGELSNLLNYELLTRLPVNIPRLVID